MLRNLRALPPAPRLRLLQLVVIGPVLPSLQQMCEQQQQRSAAVKQPPNEPQELGK
jgi:hypothetical protein